MGSFIGSFLRISTILASFLVATGAAQAQARTISPYAAGKLDSPATGQSCVGDFYGMLLNSCTTTQRVQFAITMDGTAGAKTLSVTELDSAYASVKVQDCQIWTVTPRSYTTKASLTFSALSQTLTGSFTVGANATVTLYCDMPPKSGISTITWTP